MQWSSQSSGGSPSGARSHARIPQYAAHTGALQPITDLDRLSARTIPPAGSIFVNELARQRVRQPSVRQRLPGKQLPQRQPAPIERVRGSGHVNAPYAEFLLADFGARHIGVSFESFDPAPKRLRVMLAQPFGVDQLQTGVRNAADHPAHVSQFASREYVFLDEVADAAAQMRPVEPVMGDAV